jgi:hypothetical protein
MLYGVILCGNFITKSYLNVQKRIIIIMAGIKTFSPAYNYFKKSIYSILASEFLLSSTAANMIN